MSYRTYDPERDKEAVHRIWMETGWLEKGKEEIMDTMVSAGRAIVADINGEPECLVITAPGTLRHLSEDLTMCAVTGVTTSRVARKQGFAKRLAAQAVALDAAEGAMVANLGMFEQGYYNQIGFGTIGYEHVFTFDPAALSVRHKARTPRRLTMDDVEIIHAARLAPAPARGSDPAPCRRHQSRHDVDNKRLWTWLFRQSGGRFGQRRHQRTQPFPMGRL